jgi:hypothetical protein
LIIPTVAAAQAPQFRWANGQVLTYRVTQSTTAIETGERTVETSTKLDLVKRWIVESVDAKGVATVTMSLERLRMETKSPSGETLLFDSSDAAKSTPALRDELTKYINTPLTIVRIDNRGQLVEVKESKFGPASRLVADLPFKIILPTTAIAQGLSWQRPYQIKLEPPQGAGEAYDATQNLTCTSIKGETIFIAMATELKTPPESASSQIPLLPLLPTGEVVFDAAAGRLKAAKFTIQKELDGHAGEGSKYKYKSTYVEELVN